jgi:hypothetical protein
MRSVVRLVVAALSCGALFTLSTFAAPGRVAARPHGRALGVVSQTNLGHIDQIDARLGTDIYSCENIYTEDNGGAMRVRIGPSQLYLAANSNAELEDDSTGIEVLADSGTVGFSIPAAANLSVRTPAGMVRAEGGSAAAGEVTYKGTNELLITALKGNLTLDNGGELQTIPEGKSADVTFQDSLSQACHEGAAPPQFPHDKISFFILIPAGLAIPSYILWQEQSESPSKPGSSF